MEEKRSMTALVSAFSRAYHAWYNQVKIFDDSIARLLLSNEEYAQVSGSMSGGISFFDPSFSGTQDAALRWIADNYLSPSPLGRAAFAEKALQTAVKIGTRQYLILGAGYDTFAFRQPTWAEKLRIFMIDHPSTAEDMRMRLDRAKIAVPDNVHFIDADFTNQDRLEALTQNALFDASQISFCSMLGVVYYLSRWTFEALISALSTLLPRGGAIVFDYPDENSFTEKAGIRAKKQALLAGAANERMLASYSYEDMEQLLSAHGLLIFEHLTPPEITRQYFAAYNHANQSHPMAAFDNVNYCLAVKS